MTYGQSLVVHKQLSSFDGWLVIFILKEKTHGLNYTMPTCYERTMKIR